MKRVLQPRLYMKRILIEGSYELDLTFRDVSIVVGPNGTGKSVLCNLLHFLWTGSTASLDDIPEVRDAVVYLETIVGDTVWVLRRAIYQPGHVGVYHDSSLSDYSALRQRLPDDVFTQDVFGELVMKKLGLGLKSIFTSPKNNTQKTFGLSQMYGFMYFDQYTPPQDMYPYGPRDTDQFIWNAMNLMLGVDSLSLNQIQRKIATLEQRKKELKVSQDTIVRFLEQTAGIRAKELEKQRKDLAKRHDLLVKEREGLDSKVHSAVPHYPEHDIVGQLRSKLDAIERVIGETDKDLADLTVLENETLAEMSRLQRVSIPTTFDLLHITVCPQCLSPISEVEGHENCSLCHQPLPPESNNLTRVYEKSLADTKDRLVDLRAEKDRLRRQLETASQAAREVRHSLASSVANLDARTRTYVAPHFEELRVVTHDIATVEAAMAEIDRRQEILKQAEDLKKQLEDIKKELAELALSRAKLEAEEERQNRQKAVTDTLLLAYKSYFDENIVPQLETVHVDEKTLFPVINGRTWRQRTIASDLPVVRGALYYGLLASSLDLETALYPRFSVLDTPKDKGIEDQRYTEMLERFLDLATSSGTACQLILTTGEVPQRYDNDDFVLRRLSKTPTGRILQKSR